MCWRTRLSRPGQPMLPVAPADHDFRWPLQFRIGKLDGTWGIFPSRDRMLLLWGPACSESGQRSSCSARV